MTGMTINEFIDKVYYGDEIEFKVDSVTYFVQGYKKEGQYFLTVDYWNMTDGTEQQHDYLLRIQCDSMEERKKRFETAKIFHGKNIYEIESQVEVIYG